MSLKAINESYRAFLAQALRSMVFAHIMKYKRQIVATLLSGVRLLVAVLLSGWAANDDNATERVNRCTKTKEKKKLYKVGRETLILL